jgi:hypothetical protein
MRAKCGVGDRLGRATAATESDGGASRLHDTKARAGTIQAGGMNDLLVTARGCASQRRSKQGEGQAIGPIAILRV